MNDPGILDSLLVAKGIRHAVVSLPEFSSIRLMGILDRYSDRLAPDGDDLEGHDVGRRAGVAGSGSPDAAARARATASAAGWCSRGWT